MFQSFSFIDTYTIFFKCLKGTYLNKYMNLVLDYNKYNVNNVFFYEPVKNTVMEDSKFIRIIYSDALIILNGLYLKINKTDKKKTDNIDKLVKNIELLEKNVLNKYNSNKVKITKIKDHLQYLIKKNENFDIFILKISGIWETEQMIGITFKFISNSSYPSVE